MMPKRRELSQPSRNGVSQERIWSFSVNEDSLPSPAWHGQVLHRRRTAVAGGKESYQDWEQAKREIRAAIS